jgi:AraC-like DNA-binding protein
MTAPARPKTCPILRAELRASQNRAKLARMNPALLTAATNYAGRHPAQDGVIRTSIPGLAIIRETRPTPLQYAVSKPLVALLLQGRKRVTMGASIFDLGAGESLLITAEVPNVSQVTTAAAALPYVSLVLELDAAIIESLVAEMGAAPFALGGPVRVDPTEAEVADAAARLILLLEKPSYLSILQDQLLRELHFWLLAGRHGGAIRALGVVDSHAQRIGRAIALIRDAYRTQIGVERLAQAAGMSASTFHEHFRAITSLTPLQFQKQLRLIEARRRLISEGATISNTAYAMGYESVPQFTRDYGRMFGTPPARDVRAARIQRRAA